MFKNLFHRRQFLLSMDPISQIEGWTVLRIDSYFLYAHPDLDVSYATDKGSTIVILGNIYDAGSPQKGNAEIINDIISAATCLEGLIFKIERYAGCFALLFFDNNEAFILHDARGLREVYYCSGENSIICGSQPNLIAKFSNPELRETDDSTIIKFYKDDLWDSRWIGDETYFGGIKHLLPNHYLNIKQRKSVRYWPNKIITRLKVDDAVNECCNFLTGIMRAIVFRHPVMMGVTAGSDSRTLLAALKGMLDKIYFFINDHGFGQNNPEITIPQDIFNKMGVPFHIHDLPTDVDEEFKHYYIENTFLANDRLLSPIYNVFFKYNSEKVLILGVGEIGRTLYGKAPSTLTAYRMAYNLGYKDSLYVHKKCAELIPEYLALAKEYDVNPMALLYWEQRLGNWGAARNTESLIAIEKIDPYNSHFLYETLLKVDEKYRFYGQTSCVLFRKMIQKMWPELLDWPINRPYTFRDKISTFLININIYELLKELKYQLSFLKHTLKTPS